MGYEAPLELRGPDGARWRGVAAPGFDAARDLFEALLADPEHDPARVSVPEGARLQVLLPSGGRWPFARASGARQAHLLTHRIRALGIAAPRPLAYLEAARGPGVQVSFRLLETLPGVTLGAWWAEVLDAGQRRGLLARLAVLLRTLEAQGYGYRGLTPDSLGVWDGEPTLLDVGILVEGRRGRAGPSALAQLAAGVAAQGGLSRADRMRFLRVHQAHQPSPRQAARRLWRAAAAAEP